MKHNFFNKYNCAICKKPAKMFRFINHHKYMLCDDTNCDLHTRIKHGFFKIGPIGEEIEKSLHYNNKI